MTTIEIILNFFKSTTLKRFLWTTLDGLLAVATTYFIGIDTWWALPLIGVFQFITKTINSKKVAK